MTYKDLKNISEVILKTIARLLTKIIEVTIQVIYLFLKTLKKLWIKLIRPISESIIKFLIYGKDRASTITIIVVFVGVTYALAMNGDIDPDRMPSFNSKGERHPDLYKSESLDDWISKHCDTQTILIKDKIIWYATYQKIKPEVVFAISFADTQCGNRLTTQFNYGNVGNFTDSRFYYKNAFDGWKAIVDTLNNKYLGKNEKIGQLSNGGRKAIGSKHNCSNSIRGWSCYATSEENWSRNTVRALRVMMNNDKIDNNYKIRL